MRQVDRRVSEEDTLLAKLRLHRHRKHLLISRVDIEPLIRADHQLVHVQPHSDMLESEALLKTLDYFGRVEGCPCLVERDICTIL